MPLSPHPVCGDHDFDNALCVTGDFIFVEHKVQTIFADVEILRKLG